MESFFLFSLAASAETHNRPNRIPFPSISWSPAEAKATDLVVQLPYWVSPSPDPTQPDPPPRPNWLEFMFIQAKVIPIKISLQPSWFEPAKR
jgi:hypothetical protein